MSLSQRLKEAADERRRSAGLPPETSRSTIADDDGGVLDLTDASDDSGTDAVVIDLTRARGAASGPDISYDPVRHGDASRAFGDDSALVVDAEATAYPCPRCGGRTHVDLIDQVHQTISLT